MTLDDIYGAEHDRFPLEQERAPVAGALDWGDACDRTDGAEGAIRPALPQFRAVLDAASRPPLAMLLQAPRRATASACQLSLSRRRAFPS
jgi:hypothetical protein